MAKGTITAFLIAVVLFAAIGAGGLAFIGGMNDNYGDLINTTDFSSSFGNVTLNQATTVGGDMDSSVDPGDSGSYVEAVTDTGWSWKRVTSFIRQIKVLGKTATDSVNNANKPGVLGGKLPLWFTTSVVLIIGFVIIGGIVSLVLRKDT